MIESMSTTPGVGDGTPGIAPAEAVKDPIAPAMPKAPDAAQLAENAALASAIIPDLTANPPRLDAALADAAGLPIPNTLEPDGKVEPKVTSTEPPKTEDGARIKSFTTDHGSVYTYDSDGKTTRFKTETGEQHEKQGITVFMDLNAEEAQQVLEAVQVDGSPLKSYIVERQADDGAVSIANLESVTNPDNLYLVVYENGKPIVVKKASLTPKEGMSVYDTRKYKGENGETLSERHLGNKVTSIEASEPAARAAEPAGAPSVEEPISDLATGPEAPAEPATPTEGEVDEELVSEIIAAAGPEAAPSLPEDASESSTLTEEELESAVARATESAETPSKLSFGIVDKAKKALAEAETKGDLSVSDRKKLTDEIERAEYQEAILLTNVTVLESRTIVEAQKASKGNTKEVELILKGADAKRKEAYKLMFANVKKSAKSAQREYGDVLGEMKSEANDQMSSFKSAYEEIQKTGTPQEIAESKMRYEAAREHYLMINKEKRKELLKGLLKAFGLTAVTTIISDSTKQVKSGAIGPTRH